MKRILLLLAGLLPLGAQVKITQQGTEKIAVEIDGKPFTDFYIGAQAPKPYLHPLRTASGKIVTRSWPMAEVAGEAHDVQHRAEHFLIKPIQTIDLDRHRRDEAAALAFRRQRGAYDGAADA